MKKGIPICLSCSTPAIRGGDGFCGEACRLAYEHSRERAPGRDTVELQSDVPCGYLWIQGRRVNLQNSA